ncbi:MAG: hypothetical protein RLZZ21_1488 [Planctomycetota bacterium]
MNPLHRLLTAAPLALILAMLGVACMLSSAHAENVRIVFDQVGANVIVTGSGSLTDLDGLTFSFNSNSSSLINPAPPGPSVRVGATASANFYFGDCVVTGSLGSTNLTSYATSGNGPIFGYTGSFVALPFSYSLGTQLTSTATWTNTTLEDLGLNPGTTANISWNVGSRSMVVSVVPEPAISVMALSPVRPAVGSRCGGGGSVPDVNALFSNAGGGT